MGRGDNRRTKKVLQKRAQRKAKARIKRRMATVKGAAQASTKK